MSREAEDRAMDDVAWVGSVQGPQELAPEISPMTSGFPVVICLRSVPSCPRYSPYGTQTALVSTGTSRVAKRQSEVSTLTLQNEVKEIRA